MNNVNFTYSYQNLPNTKIEDRFELNFKPISRPVGAWENELVETARAIRANTDRPLFLCLSGGIDSEVMAHAFMNAGIPFTGLTLRHVGRTNTHDVNYASAFCEKYKIKQIFADIDIFSYHEKYVEQYRATNIFRYLQLYIMDLVESLGGTAVLGGGEQIYYNVDGNINIKYDPSFLCSLDWCKNNDTFHVPYFHMFNPELLASYMQIDMVDFLLQRPEYYTSHHVMSIEKILIYHRYFPEMERRSKYNGFENILNWRSSIERRLKEKNPDLEPMFIPVSKIRTQLGI